MTEKKETFLTWANFHWLANLALFAVLQSFFKGFFVDHVRYTLSSGISNEMAQIYWGLFVMVQLPLIVQDKHIIRMAVRTVLVMITYTIVTPGVISWAIQSATMLQLVIVEKALYSGMMVAGIAGVLYVIFGELVNITAEAYTQYEAKKKAEQLVTIETE